jgi:preprotein translocase subunit YajC
MNALISSAYAQSAGAPAGGGLQTFILIGAFAVFFYLMLLRPQQKKAKEHRAMLDKLASGDEVVTSGGILGRITDVGDTFITIEVADGVRIRVQKGQVGQLVPKGTIKGN